jgi:hypothetical protein
VIYLGVLFALKIVRDFAIFDVVGDLRHQTSWTDFGYTVATIAGLLARLMAAAPGQAQAELP